MLPQKEKQCNPYRGMSLLKLSRNTDVGYYGRENDTRGPIVSIVLVENGIRQWAGGASTLITLELSFTERRKPRETKPKKNPIRNV